MRNGFDAVELTLSVEASSREERSEVQVVRGNLQHSDLLAVTVLTDPSGAWRNPSFYLSDVDVVCQQDCEHLR